MESSGSGPLGIEKAYSISLHTLIVEQYHNSIVARSDHEKASNAPALPDNLLFQSPHRHSYKSSVHIL